MLHYLFDCSETNLKVKQALPDTAAMGQDISLMAEFSGRESNAAFPLFYNPLF